MIQRVSAFVSAFQTAGFTEWQVLNSAADIPYVEGDRKNPSDYQDVIHPPSAVLGEDGDTVVTLYTWTDDMGVLVLWEVTVQQGEVTFLHAEVVDTVVGHVSRIRTEGPFLPRPGKVMIHERWIAPLP